MNRINRIQGGGMKNSTNWSLVLLVGVDELVVPFFWSLRKTEHRNKFSFRLFIFLVAKQQHYQLGKKKGGPCGIFSLNYCSFFVSRCCALIFQME